MNAEGYDANRPKRRRKNTKSNGAFAALCTTFGGTSASDSPRPGQRNTGQRKMRLAAAGKRNKKAINTTIGGAKILTIRCTGRKSLRFR